MVEYGMLVAGIAVVAYVGVKLLGVRVDGAVRQHHVLMSLTGMRERSPVGDCSCCPDLIFNDRPKEVCHEETNT